MLHCRDIDPADFPTLLRQITAARTWVENRTGRALVNQTWLWSIDRFQDAARCAGPILQPVELEPGSKSRQPAGQRLVHALLCTGHRCSSLPALPTSTCKAPRRCWTRAATRPTPPRNPAGSRRPSACTGRSAVAEIGAVNVTYQAGYGSPATVAAPGSPVAWKPSTAYTMGQWVTPRTANVHYYRLHGRRHQRQCRADLAHRWQFSHGERRFDVAGQLHGPAIRRRRPSNAEAGDPDAGRLLVRQPRGGFPGRRATPHGRRALCDSESYGGYVTVC